MTETMVKEMKLSVKVIGTDPPCPRCLRTYELVGELAEEHGIDVELEKLVVGTAEAERYGRCISLRQFVELVGEPMPDILKFFGQVPQKEDLRVALLEAKSIEGGEA